MTLISFYSKNQDMSLWLLILSRLVTGIGVGAGSVVTPLYLGEIGDTHQKGMDISVSSTPKIPNFVVSDINILSIFTYVSFSQLDWVRFTSSPLYFSSSWLR